MDISDCREFITLARCLNFTEAANQLHITQPALSKHLAALEQELGAPLLVRDRHSCHLSEAGRIFYATASQIVAEYSYAVEKIARLAQEQPIRVDGILYDPTVESIVSLASILLEQSAHPPLVFNHHEDASMLSLLQAGEIDIIIGHERKEDLETHDLDAVPLAQSRFCAVVNAAHPLAKLKSLTAEDLRDQVLLKFVDPYASHGWRSIEEYLQRHGVKVRCRSVMGRVSSYIATPTDGAIFIQSSNVHNLKFLDNTGHCAVIPFEDDDAFFYLSCIYRHSDEQRLRFFVDTLLESRDIVARHRGRRDA